MNTEFSELLEPTHTPPKKLYKTRLIIAIVLHISIIYLQRLFSIIAADDASSYLIWCGVISQFQTLISLYMVVFHKRVGYICSMVLSLISSVFILLSVTHGNYRAFPGIVTLVGTMLIMTILHIYLQRIDHRNHVLLEQKDELLDLYEEVSASQNQLSDQNHQLNDYNKKLVMQEELLNRLAYYDNLTGLPNRKKVMDAIDKLLDEHQLTLRPLFVVFMDLDNFKNVNDTIGHQAGDFLLSELTGRWCGILHEKDLLGRIGGDEFALIITRDLTREQITTYLTEFRDALDQRFTYENNHFHITVSLGVSQFPSDGDQTDALLRNADTAMYRAKEEGKNQIHFYHIDMQKKLVRKMEIETHLVNAIERDEFFLVYQPQFYSNTSEIRGFETLLRWNSKELGSVSPAVFIPVLEETGDIVETGRWILKKACTEFQTLISHFALPPILSINMSVVQLRSPGYMDMVREVLEETGYDPANLEFEITESVLISFKERALEVMNELHNMGIRISLDDFGTGYSSLSYLQNYPFDVLKIDKSFIDKISRDSKEKEIIPAIIDLATSLGMEVVAEGVEDAYQLDYLKAHACDFIQGFYLGKPWSKENLLEHLDTEH